MLFTRKESRVKSVGERVYCSRTARLADLKTAEDERSESYR